MNKNPPLPVFVTTAKEGGWNVRVRVQPGAKKAGIAGLTDGRLRIHLAAPAVENKANKALLAFVAKTLGLKASKVLLLSGKNGREKRLRITADNEPDWKSLLPVQAPE
jgi:uncharacterized protein (TIGR00251 family)